MWLTRPRTPHPRVHLATWIGHGRWRTLCYRHTAVWTDRHTVTAPDWRGQGGGIVVRMADEPDDAPDDLLACRRCRAEVEKMAAQMGRR